MKTNDFLTEQQLSELDVLKGIGSLAGKAASAWQGVKGQAAKIPAAYQAAKGQADVTRMADHHLKKIMQIAGGTGQPRGEADPKTVQQYLQSYGLDITGLPLQKTSSAADVRNFVTAAIKKNYPDIMADLQGRARSPRTIAQPAPVTTTFAQGNYAAPTGNAPGAIPKVPPKAKPVAKPSYAQNTAPTTMNVPAGIPTIPKQVVPPRAPAVKPNYSQSAAPVKMNVPAATIPQVPQVNLPKAAPAQPAAAPAPVKRGGKKAGELSQTPGAVRKREARAKARAAVPTGPQTPSILTKNPAKAARAPAEPVPQKAALFRPKK